MRLPSPLPRGTTAAALLLALSAAPAAQQIAWFAYEPRVIDENQSTPVLLTVSVSGAATGVQLQGGGGPTVPLSEVSPGTWQALLDPSRVLVGYQPGDLHNFIGALRALPSTTTISQFVNVRTGAVPDVPIVTIGEVARQSPHLLNMREDTLLLGQHAGFGVFQRFYQLVDDDYDFVTVVEQVRSPSNRSFRDIRNDVQGIGKNLFDLGFAFGSPEKLKGDVSIPIDNLFDLAGRGNMHELGHNWLAFLPVPSLQPGIPHWPISDVANGILGHGSQGGQGLDFPFTLIEQPGGDYLVTLTGLSLVYNDLELYAMGLVGEGEVGPHFVFDDPFQTPFPGGTLKGPVTDLTIADVVAAAGPRIPSVVDSQKAFRQGTLVLSTDGLLSDEEMAFFDHMAARGESVVPLPFSEGFLSGTTLPFHLATGQRATLATEVDLQSFVAEPDSMFVGTGGVHTMVLTLGPDLADELYLILGSASGTSPGTTAGGVTLPLNTDAYLLFTLTNPNPGHMPASFGLLDAAGQAVVDLTVPPLPSSSLAGETLHHAALAFSASGQVLHVSDTRSLTFFP